MYNQLSHIELQSVPSLLLMYTRRLFSVPSYNAIFLFLFYFSQTSSDVEEMFSITASFDTVQIGE